MYSFLMSDLFQKHVLQKKSWTKLFEFYCLVISFTSESQDVAIDVAPRVLVSIWVIKTSDRLYKTCYHSCYRLCKNLLVYQEYKVIITIKAMNTDKLTWKFIKLNKLYLN